jgi:hypothetical protein
MGRPLVKVVRLLKMLKRVRGSEAGMRPWNDHLFSFRHLARRTGKSVSLGD